MAKPLDNDKPKIQMLLDIENILVKVHEDWVSLF